MPNEYWVFSYCNRWPRSRILLSFSALLGYATTIIPKKVTYYVSSLLFAVFGIKMLKEGKKMVYEQEMTNIHVQAWIFQSSVIYSCWTFDKFKTAFTLIWIIGSFSIF